MLSLIVKSYSLFVLCQLTHLHNTGLIKCRVTMVTKGAQRTRRENCVVFVVPLLVFFVTLYC